MSDTTDTEDDGPLPPRRNPDLRGQEAAEATLFEAAQAGRLAHAWIIAGPRGIGKATLAFRMARFVFSGGGGAADEPGLFGGDELAPPPVSLYVPPEDPVFRRVASGGHADLLTVERGYDEERKRWRTEITVDKAREVSAFLSRTSAEGGWRVVIVDGIETMNTNAANAILKVLEEPPERALLMLVSHNAGRLLPTIRSRCRFLRLPALSEVVVRDLLMRHHPDLDPAACDTAVELARGSIGRALELVGGGGLDLHREVFDLLGALPDLDARALHGLADKISRDGTGDLFRNAREALEGWLAGAVRQRAQARAGGLDRWFEVWEKTARLLGRGDSLNLDRKQLILNVFFLIEDAARS